jgi:hypothetical protein
MERERYMPEELTWQFAFRMALTGTAAQTHTPYEQTLDITVHTQQELESYFDIFGDSG